MTTTQTRRGQAQVLGQSLHFRARGEGLPVLLLHGLGADSRIWDPFELPGCELIAVDLPGFGSSAMDRGLGSARAYAELLRAFMCERRRHAPDERFAVVGHSFGGLIGLELAMAFPESVRAALLISVAAQLPALARLYGAPFLGEAIARVSSVLPVSKAAVRAYLGFIFGQRSAVSDEAVDAYSEIVLGADYHHAMLGGVRTVLQWKPSGTFASLRTPTALVWGERDRLLPIRLGRELAKRLPQASFHALSQVGHCPHEEAPREVAAIARRLLDRSG